MNIRKDYELILSKIGCIPIKINPAKTKKLNLKNEFSEIIGISFVSIVTIDVYLKERYNTSVTIIKKIPLKSWYNIFLS